MALGYRASYLCRFMYGVSCIEKCERAHRYFLQTFNYHEITIMAFLINPSPYLICINFMYVWLLIQN